MQLTLCRAALEYKYIIRSGNKVVWQPGENLTIQVPEEAGQINDVWPGEGGSEGDLAAATSEEASLDAPEALPTEMAAANMDVSMVGAPNSKRSLLLLSATSPDVAPGSMLHQTLEEELEKVRHGSHSGTSDAHNYVRWAWAEARTAPQHATRDQ